MARASSTSAPSGAGGAGPPPPPRPPTPPKATAASDGGGNNNDAAPPRPRSQRAHPGGGPSSSSSSSLRNPRQLLSAELSVATFNVRGVMDRWRERRPALAAALADLDADVLCLQEVLTGEARQDASLLAPLGGYGPPSPLACRAALANLASGSVGGWAGTAAAAVLRAALAVPPLAAAMAALPAAAEAWRERQCCRGGGGGGKGGLSRRRRGPPEWTRAARDASMAPFFGNSIAVRSSSSKGGRREQQEEEQAPPPAAVSAAASSSWPPLVLPVARQHHNPGAQAQADGDEDDLTTPSAWPRTPGEAVAAAFARCCRSCWGAAGGRLGAADASPSPSPSPSSSTTTSRVWVEGGHEVLVLGGFRAAHRVLVGVRLDENEQGGGGGGGEKKKKKSEGGSAADADADDAARRRAFLWVVNAHLDHADPATRAEQARAILRWIDGSSSSSAQPPSSSSPSPFSSSSSSCRQPIAAVVLAGDFNAPPAEQGVHGALRSAGFVSAHATAHGGREPERTWPTGLRAPLADDEGEPHCADYVYVREEAGRRRKGGGGAGGAAAAAAADQSGGDLRVRVVGARVAADEPWPADPTLRASDHAAVRAVLRVERRWAPPRRHGRAAAAEDGF
jgi:endonuclease/exonuclease/phosphatase family metal-dependent hydrolase